MAGSDSTLTSEPRAPAAPVGVDAARDPDRGYGWVLFAGSMLLAPEPSNPVTWSPAAAVVDVASGAYVNEPFGPDANIVKFAGLATWLVPE